MKVCFVTANHPPEAVGGTEQVVTALARELGAAGVDVAVVSGSDQVHDGRDRSDEEHEGIEVTRLFKRADEHDRHGFVRPRLLALLERRLSELRPAIVHVHSFFGLGLGIGELCRRLGVPLVVTCHDLWLTCARFFRLPDGGVRCPIGADRTPCVTCVNTALQTDPAMVAAALAERDRLIRAELLAATLVTAPSRTAAEFVHQCVPYTGAIEVIAHGLLRMVPAGRRAAPPQPGERLRIGTFGGLVPEKGLRELLAACRGLACELHLAGRFYDEAFAAELRATAAAQGTRLVERGSYGKADRHPARDLHLAVFPSKCQETYGLVVDEALAHGVPAVLSEHGAFAERRNTPGVLVTPLMALPSVLGQLVASPDRLAALRDSIPIELPSIRTSAARHLDLYRSLA